MVPVDIHQYVTEVSVPRDSSLSASPGQPDSPAVAESDFDADATGDEADEWVNTQAPELKTQPTLSDNTVSGDGLAAWAASVSQ